MLPICIIISAVFVYSASSSYNRSDSNITRPHYYPDCTYIDLLLRNISNSDSDEDSDEEWDCRSLCVFNVSNSFAPLFYKPNIAYFTHQGKEKATVVCPNPQHQMLVGKSRKANVASEIEDYPLVSLSSNSEITLDCNKRRNGYEAINFFYFKTVPLDAVACITKTDDFDGIWKTINALKNFEYS